jgi:hypothetical protein
MISTGADTSSAMSSTFTDLDSIKDSTKDTINGSTNGLINLGNNNAQNNNSTLGNGQAASVQQIGQSTHGSPEQGAEQLRRKSPMRSRPDLRVHIPVSSHASSVSHQNKKILS